MQTKTKILIAALVAGGIVVATQRKKIMAIMNMSGLGNGPIPSPPPPLQQTAAATQSVAQIVNTTVTSLAGIGGLALTAMTLSEKKKALSKA